jgi:hypothetical protein
LSQGKDSKLFPALGTGWKPGALAAGAESEKETHRMEHADGKQAFLMVQPASLPGVLHRLDVNCNENTW